MNFKNKTNNKNNSKIYFIFFTIIVILFTIFILEYYLKNNPNQYSNSNSNSNSNTQTNEFTNNQNINNTNSNLNIENKSSTNPTLTKPITEKEIASFSTNLSGSSSNRLTNIEITCNKLNNKIVKKDETFSFENTIGPSKAEEGYKEATAFFNGEKIQTLGGGNCQVSSTLYNAVLQIKDLKIIERHKHGKKVNYVPENKDAAVSYGSIDFKFKNNTKHDLKLLFSTDKKTITVKILELY